MSAQPKARAYGKLNSYSCGKCGGIICTLDVEEGVTPFMLPCLATDNCTGWMHSACYRGVPPIRPHYLWRKPTSAEYSKMSRGMKEHIDQGGLEIYAATMTDPATVNPGSFKP